MVVAGGLFGFYRVDITFSFQGVKMEIGSKTNLILFFQDYGPDLDRCSTKTWSVDMCVDFVARCSRIKPS